MTLYLHFNFLHEIEHRARNTQRMSVKMRNSPVSSLPAGNVGSGQAICTFENRQKFKQMKHDYRN